MLSCLIAVFILTLAFYYYSSTEKNLSLKFCTCGGDDSDMKIMPEPGTDVSDDDSDDDAADEYLRERKNGNMEKAHALGKLFARDILDKNGTYMFGWSETESLLMIKHRRILFSFVVDRIIDENCPNQLLAQAALNVFYDEMRAVDREFYDEMNSSGAFSLYLISVREENAAVNIGKDFARLCQVEGNTQIEQMAEHLYDYFVTYCENAVKDACFSK